MNKYTLLAATAILSMGAINAMAGTVATETMKVHVGFVDTIALNVDIPLDFGLIKNPVAGDKVVIGLDSNTPITGTTDKLISGTTTRGVAYMDYAHDYTYNQPGETANRYAHIRLDLPNEIKLSTTSNEVCGYVSDFKTSIDAEDGPRIWDNGNSIYIGGTFEVKAKTGDTLASVDDGSCSGDLTMTAVLYYDEY